MLRNPVVLAVCLLLFPFVAIADARPQRLDPSRPIHEYVLNAWRDTTGLPVDSVGSIAQTPDGYLWLSTEQGVVRFDGTRFTVFTKQNTPALRTNDIYTLFVSRDGTLWIGTRGGGAVRLANGEFTRVPVLLRHVLEIAESDDGAVWLGGYGGLARLHRGTQQIFMEKEGYPGGRLMAMAGDASGVYVAFPSGVTHIDARGVRTWSAQHGLAHPVTALRMTARGLLAGNEAGGVDRLAGERFETLIRPRDGGAAITSILEGVNESLWMSTAGGGILRYAKGTVARLTARDGLSSDTVNQLIEDFEGHLWATSTGGGVVRIKEPKIQSVDTRQPLLGDWVLPLMQARDGSIWFATNGGGLNHLTDRSLTRLTTANGLKTNMISALVEDDDGSVWVGTDEGLQRVANGKVVETIATGGLEHARVHAITAARDGSLWVGANDGLFHIQRGAVRKLGEKDGVEKGGIISIREAGDGTLWLARPRAVEHYGPGKGRLACFTRREGLQANAIYGISIDETDGSIWIATSEDGLGRIRDGRLRMYRAADGLLTNSAYTVVQDTAGNLWIPTSVGLYTIKRATLDRFDAGEIDKLRIDSFRKADGLKSSDFSGGFDRAGFRSIDGTLWFPTTRGMVVVDPSRLRVNRNPPRVLIESVVATATRHVEVSYTAPSYDSPESTTFRTKLEGFETEWQDAGPRRTAYFTNVPPGSYRFRVQATTADGITREASAPLRIEPRIHETRLFKLGIGLTLLLIVMIIFRRRIEAIHARQAALRKSEEHFRSLIENAADMILVVSSDGAIRYLSPSVHRALGVSASRLSDLLADREAGYAFLAAVWTSGHHSAVLPFRDADGAHREVESIGARLEDSSDIILNCRDITDRRKLETQLEQANRLASLGRLAATVSHEFNNVLMGIQPYVDVLKRTAKERKAELALTQIGQSIRRGKRISEEILSFTRPVEPNRRAIRVREWLLDLEIELRALVGVNVRVAIVADDDLLLDGDAGQLSQVLTNLAINARDAGAVAIRIEASGAHGSGVYPFGVVREAHRNIHLCFADNGGGIPEHVLPNIFEPLFTTKRAKGTGLGLAVAQKVVAAHGGEIFVESRTGIGTTFHLFLPAAAAASSAEEDNVVSIAAPQCRVLLVEDDSVVADGILTLLEAEGFEAALATNGGDALNLIPRFEPDVIVLDIGLPDMSGIEVYDRIAKRWPGMQVIFSTGHDVAAPDDKTCLLKPYTIDDLLAAIADCVAPEARMTLAAG